MVDVEQRRVVYGEVGTYCRMHARRALAPPALLLVTAAHSIHVGRWPPEVAYIALEVFHLRHGLDLTEDRLLAARHDELALVCRYGAECASPEASPVDIDRVAYHFVGRDAFTPVFGMRHTRVGQVESVVYLRLCHRRVGGIDHDHCVAGGLYDA